MGIAADLAMRQLAEDSSRIWALRDRLWEALREAVPGVRNHGDLENGLPNTLNISVPGWDAEELLLALDREGIEVGTGSACTTGQTTPSHVLLAMGVPPAEAKGSIRFSLGKDNTQEEIDAAAEALAVIVKRRKPSARRREGAKTQVA
jgi:cysteine desulfurase